MSGFLALFRKELLRFWKVVVQTVIAPVVTALLYLLIFSHVLEAHVQVYPGVSYTAFLVPGLVMMSMLQNAFSNSSSSLFFRLGRELIDQSIDSRLSNFGRKRRTIVCN